MPGIQVKKKTKRNTKIKLGVGSPQGIRS
jgi:hypothetical protein